MITNQQSGTRIDEIATGIYRINTPLALPGEVGFSFNQYLIVDDAPMLFHSGMRRLFPLVSEAIRAVMPVERLRYVGLSHFEADECGALNEFLAAAPNAVPVCGQVAALVSVNDYANRAPRVLADGELLALGRHTMKWFDTPHVPHAWECGLMLDTASRTFFCGDLFTQGGAGDDALTEADILGPSEAVHARQRMARRRRAVVARARGRARAVAAGARRGLNEKGTDLFSPENKSVPVLLLPQCRERIDAARTQRRNQRRARARGHDAKQARAVRDRIEELHDRADLLGRRRREQRGAKADREHAADQQPNRNGPRRLPQHERADAAAARAERHAYADLARALLDEIREHGEQPRQG
jgi:glyoxylase-like metal-dependent hydrolase (beta-lactamase superfamily II)